MTMDEALERLRALKPGDEAPPEVEAFLRGKIWDYCEADTKVGCQNKTGDRCHTCRKWICTLHQPAHLATHA